MMKWGEKNMKMGHLKARFLSFLILFTQKISFFPEISFISHISAIKPLNNICRLAQPYISSVEKT